MTTRNFVVKNGLTVGNVIIDAASGNLTGVGNANLGNLVTANFFSGNGSLLTSITGGNVTGQVGNALVAGTVYTNAQPNITSVGNLTGLTVNGVTNLGPNGNVIITGGTNGQFLQTNGSGNLSWTTIVTSGVSNGTSNIDIPVASGNVNTSVGGVANVFVVTTSGANVVGTLTATSNVSGSNLTTAGVVAATGNVSGGNLTTGGVVQATGNVTGGNVTTSGKVVASSLESNVATGTAPLVVASTTKVNNLNADLLDGYDSSVSAVANTVVIRDADGSISANTVTGTLTTAAQPNITSVGTLSSLDVTGNIQTSANLVTDLIVGKTTGVSIAATGTNQNIQLKPSGTGVVDVWAAKISNVATPVASTDAATKGYVDAAVEGLHIHAPCAAATPDTLANVTSGTITYNNGTAGVGATLTTTGTFATIDSVNIASAGTRILVKNEANAAHNGIYVFTSSTVITRAADFDTPTEMGGGDFTFVQNGTLYNDTGWVMTDPVTTVGTSNVNFVQFSGAGTYTAGTGLTLNGTQFSISNTTVAAGTYGNGDRVASFAVNSQGQLTSASNVVIAANAANLTGTTLASAVVTSSLTSVGTLGSLSVSGNATAGNVYANSGTIGASLLTGILTTAAQPNITSVGTLSSLAVTGNVAGGNLTTVGLVSATGNVSGGNLTTTGLVSATGNVSGGNLTTTGALSVTGNANVGNIGANIGAFTGNISAANANLGNLVVANFFQGDGYLLTNVAATGSLANGTSNVSIPAVNGNVNISVGGTSNVLVVTTTGANVTGTFAATGNVSGANLTTAGVVDATGNVSGGNLTTTGLVSATGNVSGGNLTTAGVVAATGNVSGGNITTGGVVAATGNVSGGNITTAGVVAATGNVSGGNLTTTGALSVTGNANVGNIGATIGAFTGNISAANATLGNVATANFFTGTLTTAAQPNITSVGTLTSLAVTGNVTAGNVALNTGLTSNRSNVAVTTNTVIDQFVPGTFRTAKYVISASGDNGFQSVETLLVHDGSNSYITIYGSICSNVSGDIIELSSNVNGSTGNVTVYATANGANTKVNLVASYIQV